MIQGAEVKVAKRRRNISLSDKANDELKALAKHYGFIAGGGGNVSGLMEAIGTGQFTLTPADKLPEPSELDNLWQRLASIEARLTALETPCVLREITNQLWMIGEQERGKE